MYTTFDMKRDSARSLSSRRIRKITFLGALVFDILYGMTWVALISVFVVLFVEVLPLAYV